MLSRLMTRKEQFVLMFVGGAIVTGAGTLYALQPARQDPPADQQIDAPIPQAQPRPTEASVVSVPQNIDSVSRSQTKLPPEPIRVAVQGAVQSPGVYELLAGDRVDDLIEAGGGALAEAELDDINRAAELIDGATLTIPFGRAVSGDGGTLVVRRDRAAAAWNPPQYTIRGWSAGTQQEPLAAAQEVPDRVSTLVGDRSVAGRLNLNTATEEELATLPGIGPKLAASIAQYREQGPYNSVDDLLNVSGIGEKRLEAVRELVTVE